MGDIDGLEDKILVDIRQCSSITEKDQEKLTKIFIENKAKGISSILSTIKSSFGPTSKKILEAIDPIIQKVKAENAPKAVDSSNSNSSSKDHNIAASGLLSSSLSSSTAKATSSNSKIQKLMKRSLSSNAPPAPVPSTSDSTSKAGASKSSGATAMHSNMLNWMTDEHDNDHLDDGEDANSKESSSSGSDDDDDDDDDDDSSIKVAGADLKAVQSSTIASKQQTGLPRNSFSAVNANNRLQMYQTALSIANNLIDMKAINEILSEKTELSKNFEPFKDNSTQQIRISHEVMKSLSDEIQYHMGVLVAKSFEKCKHRNDIYMRRRCDDADNFNYEYDNAISELEGDDEDDEYEIGVENNNGITSIDRNYILESKERLWPTWGHNVSRILNNEDSKDRSDLLRTIKTIEEEHLKQNRATKSDSRRGARQLQLQLQQQPMEVDEELDLPGGLSLEKLVVVQLKQGMSSKTAPQSQNAAIQQGSESQPAAGGGRGTGNASSRGRNSMRGGSSISAYGTNSVNNIIGKKWRLNLESVSDKRPLNPNDPIGALEYPFESFADTNSGNLTKRSKNNSTSIVPNDSTTTDPNNDDTSATAATATNTDEAETAPRADVISVDDLLNAIASSHGNYDCLGVSLQKRVTTEGAGGIDLPLPHEWGMGSVISMTSRERCNYNLSARYL